MASRKLDKKLYSRVGRACQLKFKILLEKEHILNREIKKEIRRTISQPIIENYYELNPSKSLIPSFPSTKENPQFSKHPSAVFMSPGRKDLFPLPDTNLDPIHDINYSLVKKTPVFFSQSKSKKITELPKASQAGFPSPLDYPAKSQRGLMFKDQTPRKDICFGQPSPHEERFKLQNLLPESCSKYSSSKSPRFENYASRKEIYKKKEFSPDYYPNKEFVLPKITKNIIFRGDSSVKERKDWTYCNVNLNDYEKNIVEELVGREKLSKRGNAAGIKKVVD